MARILMVIAQENFRDEEFLEPRALFQAHGHDVTVASSRAGECVGSLGARIMADIALADASMDAYDALVFVGGGGSEQFLGDPVAEAHIAATLAQAKVLAAICAAPSILARAGVLVGLPATAFPSFEDDLKAAGAVWTGADVQLAEHAGGSVVVTGNGPEAATRFGTALLTLLP